MKLLYLFICSSFLFLGCKETNTSTVPKTSPFSVTFHETHEPKKKEAPFSDAVQVGNIFYLSGQIGMDHSTRTLVEGGINPETSQAINNIKAVLAQHQLQLNDVVKATVILKDINDFNAFNEIYKISFPQKPARTTFAASGLAKGALIEIEVVAVRK